jgi:hypothetical protein
MKRCKLDNGRNQYVIHADRQRRLAALMTSYCLRDGTSITTSAETENSSNMLTCSKTTLAYGHFLGRSSSQKLPSSYLTAVDKPCLKSIYSNWAKPQGKRGGGRASGMETLASARNFVADSSCTSKELNEYHSRAPSCFALNIN